MFVYAYWLLVVFLISIHAVGGLTLAAGIVEVILAKRPAIPGVFFWILFGLLMLVASAYALAFVFSKGP